MEHVVAEVYRRFADLEAAGVSQTYFEWASAIADDDEVLALISGLPRIKRQPNLVFAAARFVGSPVGAYPPFREWLMSHWDAVTAVIMNRSTQTNEAGRCAVLLPVLARLEGPLALIEVGASAGLVLYPDRYSYSYRAGDDIVRLDPAAGASQVECPCIIDAASVPSRLPDVAWRAGVDLHPIDVRDADALAWLETLIWPEHDARRERLHAAARIVADDPPQLLQGDLIERIPELVAAAPTGARIVVFHSAVLVYLTPERRAQFADLMAGMPNVTWISNEGAGVLPAVDAQLTTATNGRMILAVDGVPVALVGPHGQSFERIGGLHAEDEVFARLTRTHRE